MFNRDINSPRPDNEGLSTVLACIVIVLAICAAYANALPVPFLFDDDGTLLQNPSLQSLRTAFFPPTGQGITVGGRPVLNASFAVNCALSGLSPLGFHVGNIVIHAFAAITLFLLIRQTLRLPALAATFGRSSAVLAALVSLLWAVHPLQTESVTYLAQRAESQVSLFYLLTLYGFVRYAARQSLTWFAFTMAACLLGMGTKEVMASAPVIVFLFDRTFVSGSFAAAWARHRRLHLALAATWIFLGCLVVAERGRGGTVGATETVGWWACVKTQPVALLRYVGLALWPSGQIFDYGTYLETRLLLMIGSALVIVATLAAAVIALGKRPALGFLALSFFLILAPSSSIVPIATQTIAEHRMYLPLAALVTFAVLLSYRRFGHRCLIFCFAAVPVLAFATIRRNADYHTEVSIWSDTVAKLPGNERAHNNLGAALASLDGRTAEALVHYKTALRLRPNYAIAHNNLGMLLVKMPNNLLEAIGHFQKAVQIDPLYADAQVNLGNALLRLPGREAEALGHYETALEINPAHAEAHNNRANILFKVLHRPAEAFTEYETALSLKPNYAEAHFNYASALAGTPGRTADAFAHFQAAIQTKPDYAKAHNSLGNLLSDQPGRTNEAVAEYQAALAADPNFAEAHSNLASVLMSFPERRAEAIGHYEEALRLKPGRAEIHVNLARALLSLPARSSEARAHLEAALQIDEKNADARLLLGELLLSSPNHLSEATACLKTAVEIAPDRAEAHNDLGIAFAQAGNLSAALAEFDRARTLKPELREASENYQAVSQALAARAGGR